MDGNGIPGGTHAFVPYHLDKAIESLEHAEGCAHIFSKLDSYIGAALLCARAARRQYEEEAGTEPRSRQRADPEEIGGN